MRQHLLPGWNPPASPTGLHTNAGANQVHLTWTAPSVNDVAGYDIYRATGVPADCTGSCTLIGTTSGSGTSFTDDHVDPSTAYTYAIRARDTSDNVSPLSDPTITTTASPKSACASPGAWVSGTNISWLPSEIWNDRIFVTTIQAAGRFDALQNYVIQSAFPETIAPSFDPHFAPAIIAP